MQGGGGVQVNRRGLSLKQVLIYSLAAASMKLHHIQS